MSKPKPTLVRRKPAPGKPIVQAKLAVGPVNDRFEREANRVADHVVSSGPVSAASPPPVISGLNIQRVPVEPKPGPEQKDEEFVAPEQRAQRTARQTGPESAPKPEPVIEETDDPKTVADKIAQTEPAGNRSSDAAPGMDGGTASQQVEQSIQRMRARPAQGLDPETRSLMEERIGTDFSGVRVHNDSSASAAADELAAKAFTVGQDTFFARGEFNPKSTAGQRLIAHELTHTVQQRGGSAAAQRAPNADQVSKVDTTKDDTEPTTTKKIGNEEKDDWEIDTDSKTITVPALELPVVANALKGTRTKQLSPASITGKLPKKGESFIRPPISKRTLREGETPAKTWTDFAEVNYSSALETELDKQLEAQKSAATVNDKSGKQFYVLKRRGVKATTSQFLISGTTEELSKHDSLLRPMLKKSGAYYLVDADHILEDQLGGAGTGDNLWLLDRSYNRSIGPQIDARINKHLEDTIDKANARRKELKGTNVKFDGRIPQQTSRYRRSWTIVFKKVKKGAFKGEPKAFWTKSEIKKGEHLPLYIALTNKELFQLGFKFKKGVNPTHINVFPAKEGGRPIRFKVSSDGTTLIKPGFFFKGIEVLKDPAYTTLTPDNQGQIITKLEVRYERRKDRNKKDSTLVKATGVIDVRHDPRLGFGGYVTRESVRDAFQDATFTKASPLSFPNVHVTTDGLLSATGQILSSKALLPGLNIPIELRGSDILIRFPIPTDKLNFGPVSITDASLEMGVGAKGFFIQGIAAISIDQIGQGTLSARVQKDDVIIAGNFDLEVDFFDKSSIDVTYSLSKDDFIASANLKFKKKSLPGVESGEATITITRESVGFIGSLNLGGLLAGSTITIGYAPETGLVIEGKNLPLPVDKIPGVNNATVTVKAVRNPETGVWIVSGGGTASLAVAGATGQIDVFFDGEAVTFRGRVDVAKGPASGFLDVTATNRAVDEEGKPIEGGPVGEFKIWGKGEASIEFGKILTGTAGLEYTPEGRVIISGEIALPPKFKVFDKEEFNKTLLTIKPPDFPIWGVKLGPVGFGIFAFVDAEIRFESFVGPGELRDTKVKATLDLDKPEDAVVEGGAVFFVPAFAGLTLDIGGGLKAQVAVAFVKGRVGLDGTLGLAADASLQVDVTWNRTDGLDLDAVAEVSARPKFEVGVNASVTAGVDLWVKTIKKTWGPWRKKLGEFGPDMELGATFPIGWSERNGLEMSLDDIKIKKPRFDAKAAMKDAFMTLV